MSNPNRIAANDLFTPSQLAIVRKRSDWKGVALVVHAWGTIAAAMALVAIFPNPITWLVAVAIIGTRQLGLAILMHDGAHGILTENQKLNMFLSQWLCAYPMLAETLTYRRYHLKHHASTQQPDDPDLILSAPFPITKKSLRRKILRDLTGQTGYQQRKAQILNAFGPRDLPLAERAKRYWNRLGRATIAQAIILGLLWAAGHPIYFVTLWLVPLLTWHQLVTRLRNIAEHAMMPDNNDPFRNARTTMASWAERVFIAPYYVNYHVEHHLAMWIPCYNLPEAHAFLVANGFGERIEQKDSYAEVLKIASSKPDQADRRGDLIHKARRERVQGTMGEGFKPGDRLDNRPDGGNDADAA